MIRVESVMIGISTLYKTCFVCIIPLFY